MIAAVGENGTKSRQLAESMRGLLLSFTVDGTGEREQRGRERAACNLMFSDLNVCL